jgi:hypothetical protein
MVPFADIELLGNLPVRHPARLQRLGDFLRAARLCLGHTEIRELWCGSVARPHLMLI